jgi:hypothetical protein
MTTAFILSWSVYAAAAGLVAVLHARRKRR